MLHSSKFILALLALFVSSALFAQHRSEEEAITIAEQFLRQNIDNGQANTPNMRVVCNKQLSKRMRAQRADMPQSMAIDAFYIFNDENNNRFVIVFFISIIIIVVIIIVVIGQSLVVPNNGTITRVPCFVPTSRC